MIYLDTDDLLHLAEIATDAQPLVRDSGALASAAARPRTSAFSEDAYPTLHEKAAALLHSLARNHPLVDGNKRTAWLAAATFLALNGEPSELDERTAVDLVVDVATGRLDEIGAIAERLRAAGQ